LDIEENEIGFEVVDGLDGFETVGGLSHDLNFGVGLEQKKQLVAREILIVDDNGANGWEFGHLLAG
jgi:hypothetical protein